MGKTKSLESLFQGVEDIGAGMFRELEILESDVVLLDDAQFIIVMRVGPNPILHRTRKRDDASARTTMRAIKSKATKLARVHRERKEKASGTPT